jgi:hypothetical protein
MVFSSSPHVPYAFFMVFLERDHLYTFLLEEHSVKIESSVLSRYPEYEATIGIEVHVQLTTQSKIFCACPNKIETTPNINICPICTGHPGVLF